MQTAAGHKADLWLRSSIFSKVESLTRHFTVASLAVLTDVKHKYCARYQMIVFHTLSVFVFLQRKTSWSHFSFHYFVLSLCLFAGLQNQIVSHLTADTTLTHPVKYHSTLSIAHCCSQKRLTHFQG